MAGRFTVAAAMGWPRRVLVVASLVLNRSTSPDSGKWWVSYSVNATDATDGPVPAACLPKSGSVFPVGRTTVTCTPVDGSGNTATARFAISVKRVRR